MLSLRIVIVEDEMLTAENIALHLRKMGHSVVGIYSRAEAVLTDFPDPAPDLFLIDIRLKGEQTGLDLAQQLKARYDIPFLFVTSNSEAATVRQAMETLPLAYITKPFTYDNLFIGIELVRAKIALGKAEGRKVELRKGHESEWIPVEHILYMEANRSYMTIHMADENHVLRQSLGKFLEGFSADEMIRIHRSFAVNPRRVESVSASKVIVGGKKIPLGPGYRERFEEALKLMNGK